MITELKQIEGHSNTTVRVENMYKFVKNKQDWDVKWVDNGVVNYLETD